MEQRMTLRFEDASLSDITDLNASFASGKLKVMYTGANQNGSEFSQEVVEAALPSIANIPIVANYDLEANEIGSHDVEVVRDGEGGLRLRNLTEPCGVVPESATAYFSEEADENGTKHNYLVIEPVILWKRQEVYRHITEDLGGHVDHSMEVNITSYHKDKGENTLKVDSFEFEALCLLEAAKPCFEGSALDVFSAADFKVRMEQMMAELRETFSKVNPPEAEIDIDNKQINTEGGNVLDEKMALVQEYGLDVETLDFALDDFSLEELREKFDAMKEAETAESVPETYELSSNLRQVLAQAFQEKQVMRPWGSEQQYWLRDYDAENSVAYAESWENGNVYGFPFSMNGDLPVIDFDAGKRMKLTYVEFDNGESAEQAEPVMPGRFEEIEAKFTENDKAWSEKYAALEADFNALKESTADIEELRSFKANAEQAEAEAKREEVFANFEDLEGNEAFEALKENSADLDLNALEKECYAIRGMLAAAPAKFAAKEKSPKILVVRDNEEADKRPYGGLFEEFGPHRK